jgi:hypothetical protein
MAYSVSSGLGPNFGLYMGMGAQDAYPGPEMDHMEMGARHKVGFGPDFRPDDMDMGAQDAYPGPEMDHMEMGAPLEVGIGQSFTLTRVPGTQYFDLDFTEVRLQDLMTLTLPCVVQKLSPKALLLLLHHYKVCGPVYRVAVLNHRDFALNSICKRLAASQGVVDDANMILDVESTRAEDVAYRLVQITHNHCIGIAQDFLRAYHAYSTGGKMPDVTIQTCAALLPRIQEIGYVAFGFYVVEMIMENHEYQDLARKGKKKAKDDGLEGITMMKCVMEDIINRVERIFDQLERRRLNAFTYMDSCRVTLGIFRVGIQRWVDSDFTSAYPTSIVLRMVDLDPQMVRFHQALFVGPQFEHLVDDMYRAADEYLATSCVYFNFCSIGGMEGVCQFMSWYKAKLAADVYNHNNMPFVSFTIRGMEEAAWALMTSDHLMRMCSMRGHFLTFEPTLESDDGELLVWHTRDSTKTTDGSMVMTLNAMYDRIQSGHLVSMPKFSKQQVLKNPSIASRQGRAMKAPKGQAEKAKAARAAKRELKK